MTVLETSTYQANSHPLVPNQDSHLLTRRVQLPRVQLRLVATFARRLILPAMAFPTEYAFPSSDTHSLTFSNQHPEQSNTTTSPSRLTYPTRSSGCPASPRCAPSSADCSSAVDQFAKPPGLTLRSHLSALRCGRFRRCRRRSRCASRSAERVASSRTGRRSRKGRERTKRLPGQGRRQQSELMWLLNLLRKNIGFPWLKWCDFGFYVGSQLFLH